MVTNKCSNVDVVAPAINCQIRWLTFQEAWRDHLKHEELETDIEITDEEMAKLKARKAATLRQVGTGCV